MNVTEHDAEWSESLKHIRQIEALTLDKRLVWHNTTPRFLREHGILDAGQASRSCEFQGGTIVLIDRCGPNQEWATLAFMLGNQTKRMVRRPRQDLGTLLLAAGFEQSRIAELRAWLKGPVTC